MKKYYILFFIYVCFLSIVVFSTATLLIVHYPDKMILILSIGGVLVYLLGTAGVRVLGNMKKSEEKNKPQL